MKALISLAALVLSTAALAKTELPDFSRHALKSHAQLAAYSGALINNHITTRREVAGGLLSGGGDNLSNMTMEQLRAEYASLDATRPSLVGPIVKTAIGGVLMITGVSLGIYSIFWFIGSAALGILGLIPAIVLAVVAVICLAVGIPLLITGLVSLFSTLRERRESGDRMEAIDRRIRELEAQSAPKPAALLNDGPKPAFTLASF